MAQLRRRIAQITVPSRHRELLRETPLVGIDRVPAPLISETQHKLESRCLQSADASPSTLARLSRRRPGERRRLLSGADDPDTRDAMAHSIPRAEARRENPRR